MMWTEHIKSVRQCFWKLRPQCVIIKFTIWDLNYTLAISIKKKIAFIKWYSVLLTFTNTSMFSQMMHRAFLTHGQWYELITSQSVYQCFCNLMPQCMIIKRAILISNYSPAISKKKNNFYQMLIDALHICKCLGAFTYQSLGIYNVGTMMRTRHQPKVSSGAFLW